MANLISEIEAAARLGKTRQTMRNWRIGYTRDGVLYEPRINKAYWRKLGATVVYDENFITRLEEKQNEIDAIFANAAPDTDAAL